MKKITIKTRYDWIRLAFILDQFGEVSLDQLTWIFNEIFHNGKTNREVSRIITCYKPKGFQKIVKDKKIFYQFNQKLPEIHISTYQRWESKIEPLKGFIPE